MVDQLNEKFPGKAKGGGKDFEDPLRMEEGRNHRDRGMPGSRTYAGGDTAKGSGIQLHGVLKREEQLNDLREVPGAQVQIPKPGVLVPWVLRGHGG